MWSFSGDSPDDVSACEEEEEDSEDDEDIVIEAVTDENGAELKPSEENGYHQKIRDGKIVDRRIREACAAAGVPLRLLTRGYFTPADCICFCWNFH